jgi:hypothetical protein
MDRGPLLWLIALGLALYGVWTALYVPAMFIGESSPLLLLGLLAQAVFALVAAAGVARNLGWAAVAVVLFAASIVFTQLVEGFALQIVPYLRAVIIAVCAIAGALALIAVLRGRPVAA